VRSGKFVKISQQFRDAGLSTGTKPIGIWHEDYFEHPLLERLRSPGHRSNPAERNDRYYDPGDPNQKGGSKYQLLDITNVVASRDQVNALAKLDSPATTEHFAIVVDTCCGGISAFSQHIRIIWDVPKWVLDKIN